MKNGEWWLVVSGTGVGCRVSGNCLPFRARAALGAARARNGNDRAGGELDHRARICLSSLCDHGVRVIFGMPARTRQRSTTPFCATAASAPSIARNEQAAAYGRRLPRVTGWPGVVCTTGRPGATNALTRHRGSVNGDSVPVLLIRGGVS